MDAKSPGMMVFWSLIHPMTTVRLSSQNHVLLLDSTQFTNTEVNSNHHFRQDGKTESDQITNNKHQQGSGS